MIKEFYEPDELPEEQPSTEEQPAKQSANDDSAKASKHAERSSEKLSVKQWAEADRPREKLMQRGAGALSDAELLAILIGSGNPNESAVDLMRRILSDCQDSLNTLGKRSIEQLMGYHGIGEAKAISILAACELGKRRQMEEFRDRLDMNSAETIYRYLKPQMQDLANEEAWVLLLNHNFKLITDPIRVSQGGLTETAMDVRMIARHAILNNATIIILAHNHPSNNPKPSRNDDMLTKQIDEGMKLLRIHLADHIIVTEDTYYSYAENGKL